MLTKTQEIKGSLAKLLATENLVVEHKNCATASFNIDERVLILPKWDRASTIVYDLLVGHEVGHALFTPVWGDFECPTSYVNVTEDARVEKLMKRRYPGLRKSFFFGYKELNDRDFFSISGEDLDTYSLIDRINLYFKLGIVDVEIPFSNKEKILVEKVEKIETFDEAVAVATEIWIFAKEQQKELEQLANVPLSGTDGGGTDSSNTESYNDTQSSVGEEGAMTHEEMLEEAERREENNNQDADDECPGGTHANSVDNVSTQESFDKATKGLNDTYSGSNTIYIDMPSIKTSNYVVDWEVIHDWIATCRDDNADYSWADDHYNQFKKGIVNEVNYLVKEFECKKAADAYSRSKTSRTGVLDCSKLHTYKYNEDLFKKVTSIPEGKNHGMLFCLDWSGSMGSTMLPTIKQLLILCMFCKKVNIPFEVYAFTNEWWQAERSIYETEFISDKEYLKKNEIFVSKQFFRMMNIISSRSNAQNFEIQCLNIFREVMCMAHYCGYRQTIGMSLSGTPLNEAIMVVNNIIPEFKAYAKVSKVNLCILTDGESGPSVYGSEVISYDGNSTRMTQRRVDCGSKIIIRDRKLGRTYNNLYSWYEITNLFIQNLKESNPDVNVMGIRLIDGNGLTSYYRFFCKQTMEGLSIIKKMWTKDKSAILPDPIAYDALYAISTKGSNESNTGLDVAPGSSKSEVKAAFKKMLAKKSSNKKVLNSFIDTIA